MYLEAGSWEEANYVKMKSSVLAVNTKGIIKPQLLLSAELIRERQVKQAGATKVLKIQGNTSVSSEKVLRKFFLKPESQ